CPPGRAVRGRPGPPVAGPPRPEGGGPAVEPLARHVRQQPVVDLARPQGPVGRQQVVGFHQGASPGTTLSRGEVSTRPAISSGRTGMRPSRRPVAARIAAQTAAGLAISGGSPTPFSP